MKKPQQDTKKGQRSLVKQARVAAACTLLAGCATTPVVPVIPVKQLPPPAPCPRGAVETMQGLGIRLGDRHHGSFLFEGSMTVVAVREGEVLLNVINDWRQLSQHATLRGRIFLMEDRVYGQFTEALLKDGTRLPVCVDMYDRTVDQKRGVVRKPGGEPGTARVWSTVALVAVDRFE